MSPNATLAHLSRNELANKENPMQPRPFLPGQFTIEPGTRIDYFNLHRFHYCFKPPATFNAIRAIRYDETNSTRRLAGVAVVSWPAPCNLGRQIYFRTRDSPFGQRLHWINQHLRTISRIIIHPQFRGIGLATDLVQHILTTNTTRFIEATSKMAAIHPFFERAGMKRVALRDEDAAYFIYDHFNGGNRDLFANRIDRPVATLFNAADVASLDRATSEPASAGSTCLSGSPVADAIPDSILF
jgi:GNAT superfamily N-acetyltransferase